MSLRVVTDPVHRQLSIRLPAWSWSPLGEAADAGRLYGWAGPVSLSVQLDDEVSGGAELRLGEVVLLSRDVVSTRPADLVEALGQACESIATEAGALLRDAVHALGLQMWSQPVELVDDWPDQQADELGQRVELVEADLRKVRIAQRATAEQIEELREELTEATGAWSQSVLDVAARLAQLEQLLLLPRGHALADVQAPASPD